MQTISCRGLSVGSLFKILFIGLLIPIFLISVIYGVFALFGFDTVTFDGKHVYGIVGLLVALVIGIVLPSIMSAVLWLLILLGVWVYTRFRPITLKLKD